MEIIGATAEGVQEIAAALGVKAVEQKSKNGELKILMRPLPGSKTFRALPVGGQAKNSLCLHGQYAFMARIFARWPDVVLKTWINTWKLALFESGARAWTLNEIMERANSETCDCTPEQAEEALAPPSKLRLRLLPVGTRIKFVKTLDAAATGDRPAITYAYAGETGVVTGHGCTEGHWVKTDSWPNPFGAWLYEEFVPLEGHK